MAFCELRYFSPALGLQTAANVILPETGEPPYPVFYLLHGLSDDHTIWCRRTSIERYVAEMPVIVVMPSGGRGFYTDAVAGFAYERAIVEDLVGLIDRTFPTRAERAGRCIGGLSMGGYGAVRLALRRPDLFCSANSHSGALMFGMGKPPADVDPAWAAEFGRILGDSPAGGPNDLTALVRQVPTGQMPALRIDCGVGDFLIEANRAYHAFLQAEGVDHEYAEYPGEHTWEYWDEHVQEALAFHRRQVGW